MQPKIAILACDALRKEIDSLTQGDSWVVSKEYLEFGLHLCPMDLKDAIVEKLARLDGKVDAIFLGYGVCQALKEVPLVTKTPTIMIEAEDCIAALLTPERYHLEKKNGGITWFYPAGWSDYGVQGLVQLFHLDTVRDENYPPEYFLRLLFDGFRRCLFIDTGMEGAEKCRENSELLASRLELAHDEAPGSLDMIRAAWERTKEAALVSVRGRETGTASQLAVPTIG